MRKFKDKVTKAIKDRKTFETKLVRVILGVNPYSIIVEVGRYFTIIIKDYEIEITEEIDTNSNWALNKKVIDKVNAILSIHDLPQFTHKYFQWYLGDKEWVGDRAFKIKNF